jgi:uncharacterized iron-regulated membrane protein
MAVGLLLVAIAGSGSILVFRHELAPTPDVRWDGAVDIGWAAARDRAIAARPDGRLQILWFPTEARPWYEAAYRVGDEEFAAPLRLHPTDGRELPPAPSGGLLAWIEQFHIDLQLGDAGAWLVRHATLLSVVLLISGIVLWWPGWRPHMWLVLRRGRGLLAFDLHRVVGLLAAPVLLLMALTGLVWAFPDAASTVAHTAVLRAPPPGPADPYAARSHSPAGPDATDADLLADARRRAPEGAFVFYLTYPQADDDHRQVRMQRGYEPWPFGEVYRYFYDRRNGSLLSAVDPRLQSAPDAFLERWSGPLHFGTVGGWPLMVVYLLAGLVPALLAVTGIILWRRRRRWTRAPDTFG